MLRRLLTIASITVLATSLSAQAPAGWQVRVDKSTNPSDPDNTPNLKFAAMGKGFHITSGPAGTFWNPANNAAGNFTVSGTFTLMKPSGHVNYYGLIFGGSDLGGANQAYTYFMVAQNGTYSIRQRVGEKVTDIQARVAHAAVQNPGASGQSINALEVRVAGDTVSYVVNGQVVHSMPKSGLAKTDGLVGVRINHLLDVHVEPFALTKK
jgi:hypothetical protein